MLIRTSFTILVFENYLINHFNVKIQSVKSVGYYYQTFGVEVTDNAMDNAMFDPMDYKWEDNAMIQFMFDEHETDEYMHHHFTWIVTQILVSNQHGERKNPLN